MRKNIRFTFLCNDQDIQKLIRISEFFHISKSATIRYLIDHAMSQIPGRTQDVVIRGVENRVMNERKPHNK